MKLCWVTLTVKDMQESIDFYEKVVGLKVSKRYKPDENIEISFLSSDLTDVKIELICNKKIPQPVHGNDISLGFETLSLDDMIQKLKLHGITKIDGPHSPNPAVRFIFIKDPNGVKIQFVESH
ncbi:MAG TPA: VOC family protein [Exilispira sp.]|jgi:lactoylglutathione lyase|nr:VOC family protein [Spirochaetota bacterium]NLJ05375.1 VOC family protein [Exilispira sp.]HOV46832.1 VOC family protein [Exilispira sp.]HPB48196.1 VOC family protein [Exilispira sp.]HQQ20096.1 VOC family protein [Exilispira sp.]